METTITPRVALYRFTPDGSIPNNPELPLLVYPSALAPDSDPAGACERAFAQNGWTDGWRNGIYPNPHFHRTAHEVLGIVRGSARVQFGGQSGTALDVAAGDVVVIPAGVAHQRLSASADLLVVGAYPEGQSADLCRADRPLDAAATAAAVAGVPLPAQDPVLGPDGPLVQHWHAAGPPVKA
jgi:uncharacterized protein YjlB